MSGVERQLAKIYLPPGEYWTSPVGQCLHQYESPQALPFLLVMHLCKQRTTLHIRIDVVEGEGGWPTAIDIDLSHWKQSRMTGHRNRSTLRLEKTDGPNVTYQLKIDESTLSPNGLCFSITFGTQFLVPHLGIDKGILRSNPFCIDDTRLQMVGALAEDFRSKMALALKDMHAAVTRTQAQLPYKDNYLMAALLPQCVDTEGPEDLRGHIQRIRSLMNTEFVAVITPLNTQNVAIQTEPLFDKFEEFSAELLRFQLNILYPHDVSRITDTQTFIEKRVSLFVYLMHMITESQGASTMCQITGLPLQHQNNPYWYQQAPVGKT